jgi:ribose transport system ATP-binding protein
MQKKPIAEVKKISKVFPGVRALNEVDLKLIPGEVHGLVGENGAGKSTLIKIISGVYQPNSGEILFNGKREIIKDPAYALHLGIVPVHQELNLEQNLSVAENIYIGRQPKTKLGLMDYREMNRLAKKWLNELGIDIDPDFPLGMLSVAEKQMVSIARAISLDAKLLIFDEPTSSLTDIETNALFEIICKLRDKNIAILYISHRIEEVFHICDCITVMRDGSVVGNKRISEVTIKSIIQMMIGRDLKDMYQKSKAQIGDLILEVNNLNVKGILKNISFKLFRGEILGIAGLVGSGRTELARAIFGDLKRTSGQIIIDGKVMGMHSPIESIGRGVGLVPEDRKEQGLVLDLTVANNICMSAISKITNLFFLNQKKENKFAKQYVDRLNIQTPSTQQVVKYLSGGNQQRVVIAKWLMTEPKILIVDEPTRGIDVGAKSEIHKILNDLAQQGVSIVMVSSELPEILAMCDRILVMHEGTVVTELIGKKTSEEEVLHYAVGQAAA